MVFVDTSVMGLDPLEAVMRVEEEGVGATIAPPRVRMVTHVDISDEDIETALAAWRTVGGDASRGGGAG
jgi:threonine aldolase